MLTSVLGRAIGRRATNHVGAPWLYSSILFITSPHVRSSFDFGAKAAFATATKGSSKTRTNVIEPAPGGTARKGRGPTSKTTTRSLKKKPVTKKKDTKLKAKPKRKAVAKTKEAKIEYTKPPKRPLTSYMLYLQEQSTGTVPQSIGGNIELIKQVAQKWRDMSLQEKLPYERRYTEAREKYAHEREAWLKSLSPKGLRQYRSASRKRRLGKGLKDASGQPIKRALNGWNIFLKDAMAREPKSDEKISAQLAAIAGEWRQLNNSEKAQYATRATEGRTAYAQARDKQKDEARAKFYKVHNLNP